MCFQKWYEEFGKFSPEHLKVLKLGLWWDFFVQIWKKYMSLKFTGKLCVMTMNNYARIEEALTCQFNTDMRKLTMLDLSTWKFGKFALWWAVLWPQYKIFELKKYRGIMFDGTEYWWILMHNLKENWLVLSKMTKGIWKVFTRALESLKIEILMGFFFPK